MRHTRRSYSGAFSAQALSPELWQIVQSQPRRIEIFVRGADFKAAQVLTGARLQQLEIEWRDSGVLLSMLSGERPASVGAASVIVHEPLERLYEALPLAVFDAKAQRFWSRVFAVVRLPGGRQLLRFIARSGRRRS